MKCVDKQRMCVVYTRIMNTLELIISSRTRAGIFTILFGLGQRELHNREIARRSKHSEAAVRQELTKLAGLGLVHPNEPRFHWVEPRRRHESPGLQEA